MISQRVISWPTGAVYKVNKIGRSIDPWGTPKHQRSGIEDEAAIRICWRRSDKYDWSQESARPLPQNWCSAY